MRLFPLAALALSLAVAGCLPGCAPQANTLATSTPTTNAAQQVAGTAYGAFLTADTAWVGFMESGKATKAQVLTIRPLRQRAKAALDDFAAAANTGNQAAARSAFDTAMKTWTNALTGAGVTVPAGS